MSDEMKKDTGSHCQKYYDTGVDCAGCPKCQDRRAGDVLGGVTSERAAFEKAMKLAYGDLERSKDGAYVYAATRTAWLAWQARAALPVQAQPVASNACPACPLEVRDLFAVAHNVVVDMPGIADGDLKRAVKNMQPLIDRHFANRDHSHPPALAATQPAVAAAEGECGTCNGGYGLHSAGCPDSAPVPAQGEREPSDGEIYGEVSRRAQELAALAAKVQPVAVPENKEASKLARILFDMCEGGGLGDDIDIYAEEFQAGDGDVFVHRAGELLVEQAGEIEILTATINLLSDQLAAAPKPAKQAGEDDARDAARYRYLRESACEGYPSSEGSCNKDAYLIITGYDDLYPMTDAQKDAAVDAALAPAPTTNEKG